LSPTAETAGVPFGLVLFHRRLETAAWDQLENLAENAAYSFPGGASSVEWFVLLRELNQTTRGFTPVALQLIWTRVGEPITIAEGLGFIEALETRNTPSHKAAQRLLLVTLPRPANLNAGCTLHP
jgi:hypothetical protein